jgi:hypothetical protein
MKRVLQMAVILIAANVPVHGFVNGTAAASVQVMHDTALALSVELQSGGPSMPTLNQLETAAVAAQAALEKMSQRAGGAPITRAGVRPATTRFSLQRDGAEGVSGGTSQSTIDTVFPPLPVSCTAVVDRMRKSVLEGRQLNTLLRQLVMLLEKDGVISDDVRATATKNVLTLAKGFEDTYPSAWDDKTFVITRQWSRPSSVAQQQNQEPMWDSLRPVAIFWHGANWTPANMPQDVVFTARGEAFDVTEHASLTTVCLEPRWFQILVTADSAPSGGELGQRPASFILLSRGGSN